MITLLCIYFTIPIVYVMYNRNNAAILTRSPYMIAICFFLMGGDSIINVILYGLDIEIES